MRTSTKIVIAVVSVAVVAAAAVGVYLIIKNINDENHKKDIEMAADCARTFDVPNGYAVSGNDFYGMMLETNKYNTQANNSRNAKRQECAEKYHVTHQEIIDEIGTDIYWPKSRAN